MKTLEDPESGGMSRAAKKRAKKKQKKLRQQPNNSVQLPTHNDKGNNDSKKVSAQFNETQKRLSDTLDERSDNAVSMKKQKANHGAIDKLLRASTQVTRDHKSAGDQHSHGDDSDTQSDHRVGCHSSSATVLLEEQQVTLSSTITKLVQVLSSDDIIDHQTSSSSSATDQQVEATGHTAMKEPETVTASQRAKCVLEFLLQQPSSMIPSVKEFYQSYWEKQPLLVQANSQDRTEEYRHRFDGLLSLESVQTMIANHPTYYGRDLNVTRYETDPKSGLKRRFTYDLLKQNKNPSSEDTDPEEHFVRVNPDELWERYADGCTVRLLCPHKHANNVHSLLSLLELEWGCMVGANAYLTPPSASQGFAPHYDDIEAFCLQLEGKKRWKVYAPLNKAERLPRVSSEDYTTQDLEGVEPVMDVILEPGDCLYMPRGWIHQACTLPKDAEEQHSLHLTISTMQQWAWIDLMEMLLPEALQTVADSDTTILRAGLPRRFLDYTGAAHDNDEETLPDILKPKGKVGIETDEGEYQKELLRQEFRSEMKKRLDRVTTEAMQMLDAVCDQMGKRFCSDRLPPAWTTSEKKTLNIGENESVRLLPDTLCRLARPGIARMVLEDGKAVLYHCADNSVVYHERALSPMEFDTDDAPAIEQLLTTKAPHWILVNDLIHDTIEDKIGVAQALFDEGIISIRQ